MEFNLEGKMFRSVTNTENGEVGADTLFSYHQRESVVWAEYEGGDVVKGQLVANVLASGQLDMRYHHINRRGEIMIGKCLSTPELLSGGKIRFKEEWQWLSGDMSSGYSEIVEQ
ncbi:n-acetylglutamate synthase [Sulfuriferula thiophila]|uniref:n-acetylglutamate synthase n=1 Tax=Sulfuriferula thiophila TaxID=1781211 RepID=UPI000F611417|nr:n-acetylglutamate synthase [Sulfuriferula thiophila]